MPGLFWAGAVLTVCRQIDWSCDNLSIMSLSIGMVRTQLDIPLAQKIQNWCPFHFLSNFQLQTIRQSKEGRGVGRCVKKAPPLAQQGKFPLTQDRESQGRKQIKSSMSYERVKEGVEKQDWHKEEDDFRTSFV